MNRNKKLIALICAISMIFSVFTAFTTIVSADEITKGIVLEYDAKASTTTKAVINASYVGADAINGYSIKLQLPAKATASFATAITGIPAPTEFTDATNVYGVTGTSSAAVSSADKKIGTITITLAEALASEYKLALLQESALTLPDGELYLGDDPTAADYLPVATVTVPTDPKATVAPDAVAKPTKAPADSTDPTPTKAPVDVTKGIVLTLDTKASTATTKVINASYVGADAINGYSIKLQLPAKATASFATAITGIPAPTEFTDATNVYGVTGTSSAAVSSADKKIGTITITLAEALTTDLYLELLQESALTLPDGELYLGDDPTAADYLPPAWVKVPAKDEVAPTVKKELKLSNMIDKAVAEAAPADHDVYITVSVDPATAVYGTDYVAKYNGRELGPNEFKNLISGYDESNKDMAAIIAGITFDVYNTGVVKSISAVLNDGTTNKQLDSGSEKVETGSQPSAKSPKLTVTSTKAKANPGDKVTVTTKLTNPGTDGKLTVKTTSDSLDVIARSGIKVVAKDGTEKGSLDAGVETEIDVTDSLVFTAQIKGSVVLTYNYTCTNNLGEADQIDKPIVKEIKIVDKTVSGPGPSDKDDDDGNGMGPIAGPVTPDGTTMSGFDDVANVPWALEAITVLSSKGIISGRGNNKFDPDASITRAEYCQILIGAIDKTQEAADSSFDDVASDAWYYHAVSVASKYGIVSGYGDGNFGPNNLITRQDMALMTMKAAQVMNKDLTAKRTLTFADAGQISDYASEAVSTLANAGIINGVSDTEFAPKANATRAQAAVILYQTFVKAN